MDRANYLKIYSVPETCKSPDDISHEDTYYPNLNSRDYCEKQNGKLLAHNEFYESFAMNEVGLTVLATNQIRGRIWNGNIWGYEDIDHISEADSSFKLHCDCPVTKLMFLQDKIMLVGQSNGSVSLWSTQSEARNASGYCLFMISSKTEHNGMVLGMDILLPDKIKVVTGSSDCSIKIWDTGAADLTSILSIRNAHSDDVTGISANSASVDTFVSCSRDKSALIWDYRQARPAIAIYENHSFSFSTISCVNDNIVVIGDEAGSIFHVDLKMPNKFVSQLQVFDRPIRKISYFGDKLAIIGNTNAIHVYDTEHCLVYSNQEAENFVRDILWYDQESLYTISWDQKLRHHSLRNL